MLTRAYLIKDIQTALAVDRHFQMLSERVTLIDTEREAWRIAKEFVDAYGHAQCEVAGVYAHFPNRF